MYLVLKSTLDKAHKPFDLVTDKDGNVGLIRETSINDCQPTPEHQLKYSVEWLVGDATKVAWFDHDELTAHCNLFVKIAQMSCHPHGNNKKYVHTLFNHYTLFNNFRNPDANASIE